MKRRATADHVLRGMGLGHLRKTDRAIEELRRKGMAPPGTAGARRINAGVRGC